MQKYTPKPEFIERMKKLLPDQEDREAFWSIVKSKPPVSIRCNKLKISPEKLKSRLEKKGWKISQPFSDYPEIMIIDEEKGGKLAPGELGKTKEHLLGYYYVQEISSIMPIIALKPNKEDIFLDLCASPGSKTTHASVEMQNQGIIIANDVSIGRISILASNLEKTGSSNTIITRHDGVILSQKLKNLNLKFTKILTDVPCTGEGNIRSNPKTFLMWNLKIINKLSRIQKKLASSVIPLLKQGATLLYSTCTHSPEENELIINSLLENSDFNLEVENIELPKEFKTRPGITSWENQTLHPDIKKSCRIYPQDNNTEGFFLCKLRKK